MDDDEQNMAVVMSITGHKSFQAFKRYFKVSATKKLKHVKKTFTKRTKNSEAA
jgi:hypothetical protein